MAKSGLFHHVGTFLLFAAAILLLITTITAPVVNDFSMMKVHLKNSSSVSFGTFGYCVLKTAPTTTNQDYCTSKHVGYSPARVMTAIESTDFSSSARDTADSLTRVQILHPIVCGLAFVAFLLALGAGVCGALLASFTAAITWILTLVVMATDFTLWGIVKNHVNDDRSGSHARFGAGMWCVLTAMLCLFFATFLVLFTCFSARRQRKDGGIVGAKTEYPTMSMGTTSKRKFWQRRNRY